MFCGRPQSALRRLSGGGPRRRYAALAYSSSHQRLRTGLTHLFERREDADRSVVHGVWQRTGSGVGQCCPAPVHRP
jgi:hypothetical protein